MNGKTLLAEAIEMKDEIVENRRAIHRAPEVGAHLPQTVQFVEEKLRLLGYEPRELGGGVVAELTGEDKGRCILLRADMDALKVRRRPTCRSVRKTAACTPADTICMPRCCWALQGCSRRIKANSRAR